MPLASDDGNIDDDYVGPDGPLVLAPDASPAAVNSIGEAGGEPGGTRTPRESAKFLHFAYTVPGMEHIVNNLCADVHDHIRIFPDRQPPQCSVHAALQT